MNEALNPNAARAYGFRAPRFDINFHFFLEVNATRGRFDAVSTDIGVDGLAADLTESIDPDTQVTLWLLFPGATVPLRLQALVEYRRLRRHGFNFLYSSPDERASVEAFVRTIQG
jgi:hypothetical protein